MKPRVWWLLGIVFLGGNLRAAPIDLREKSFSSSRQFIVYSLDRRLRTRVAGFAEDLKNDVLHLLGVGEPVSYPVVITLERAPSDQPGLPPVRFSTAKTDEGFRFEIDVEIGENPAEINLQRHILRAVLLSLAFQNNPGMVHPGDAPLEPPWWVMEGILRTLHKDDSGIDPELFRQIVVANKLPSIAQFLAFDPDKQGAPATAIDAGCALSLVQALLEQPSGKQNLARYIEHLAGPGATDPVQALLRDFPSLGDAPSLEKWWTLNLARYSASDRFQGMTAEETDAQLSAVLQLEIPGGKGGEKKRFEVSDFEHYLKLRGSKDALTGALEGLVALSARANALYRGVIVEYQKTLEELYRGKTHGAAERLAKANHFRELLLKRTDDVADYINWYEATQMASPSDSFAGYLKQAEELSKNGTGADPVAKYLDGVETELRHGNGR